MDASLITQSNHGIMVEEEDDNLGSLSSSPSDDSSNNSVGSSSSSDFMDDATSSEAPPPSEDRRDEEGPLYEMSCLMAQLPFKRGLSRFYQGKCQSFACLSNVRCLEDLAKPERPYKKLKSSQSCGGGLDSQRSLPTLGCSRVIKKRASRASFSSSISARRHSSFLGSRPPIPLTGVQQHF